LVPDALEELSPEEHHQVYRMLRLKVVAHLDATLEVTGAFSEEGLGKSDSLQRREPRDTRPQGQDSAPCRPKMVPGRCNRTASEVRQRHALELRPNGVSGRSLGATLPKIRNMGDAP
jgi:hypothetical protein